MRIPEESGVLPRNTKSVVKSLLAAQVTTTTYADRMTSRQETHSLSSVSVGLYCTVLETASFDDHQHTGVAVNILPIDAFKHTLSLSLGRFA